MNKVDYRHHVTHQLSFNSPFLSECLGSCRNEFFSSVAEILEVCFDILQVALRVQVPWMHILGQHRTWFWALVGHPPCALAAATAVADAQGTWLLPMLISGIPAIVCGY